MAKALPIPSDFVTPEWFAERVRTDRDSGCHNWVGKVNPRTGYGSVYRNKQSRAAHRVAWMLSGRSLSPELVLDHICRNRACVNVDHLEQVSQRENTRRGEGQTSQALNRWAQGLCVNGHVLSAVGVVKQGKANRCRKCANDRVREYRLRKLAALSSIAKTGSCERAA